MEGLQINFWNEKSRKRHSHPSPPASPGQKNLNTHRKCVSLKPPWQLQSKQGKGPNDLVHSWWETKPHFSLLRELSSSLHSPLFRPALFIHSQKGAVTIKGAGGCPQSVLFSSQVWQTDDPQLLAFPAENVSLELMRMVRLPGPFPYPLQRPGVITSVSAVPSHTHVLQKCLLQGQRTSLEGAQGGFLACEFRLKLLLYKPYWAHFLLQACAVLRRASLLKSGITRKWLLHAQGSEAEESAITWNLHH